MTLMEMFGCSLVTFSPALCMFIFTVAGNPLKIIILTCSAFFWLLALLLSSVVWFALVPLRQYLVVGMIVSIMFQEAIRVGYYFFMKRAEEGLQKIALAEEGEEPNSQQSNATLQSGAQAASGSAEPPAASDRAALTASRPVKILHLHTLSYVCGLGFGFMAGAFSMVNLLADMSGPGSVGLGGEHEGFLLVSALLSMLFIFLNVCWTVVTFVCIEDGKPYFLVFVWATHLLCSLLTLLNSSTSPLLSLVPILAAVACSLAGAVLSLSLVNASVGGFFLSLVSPGWVRQLRRGR